MTAALPTFQVGAADSDVLTSLHNEAVAAGLTLIELAVASRVLARHLSATLRYCVSSALTARPYCVVVAGLPIDDANVNPVEGSRNSLPPSLADSTALLISALGGQAFGLASVQAGNVVTDIRPRRASEGKRVGSDAGSDLLWHTDNAYTAHGGDRIGLLYVRNDAQIPTVLAPLEVERLSPKVLTNLSEPRFVLQPNRRDEGVAVAAERVPVLFGSGEDTRLRVNFNRDMVVQADAELLECLDELRGALDAAELAVRGAPGELLLFDNRRVAHRRPSFTATYEKHDRWLKRTYISVDPTHCPTPDSLVVGV